MGLTVEQALQQAVEAHKAGNLQNAEALYRAILQTQPKHPDANHNLGVLAFSLNKSELALPFFKTALEANSKQVQFWISYVDALIKTNQLGFAKSVLEQGKKRGLAGQKVEVLEAKLSKILPALNSEPALKNKILPRNLIKPGQIKSPPQIEINKLLTLYQTGQLDLAQNLATTLTEQYSNHPFSWKVLGALFKQTGKLQDSLIANLKVLEISPNDVEAHNNLGSTLKELGRLEDAETSYNKAIAIMPDLAVVHNNLGNTLKELGRLEDAETSYNKAIAIRPDYAEAHSSLGITLQELGRLENAETSYKKAIVIKPDFAEAHYNLGNTLHELGRLEDSETSYKKAIGIKPDFAEAHYSLGITRKGIGRVAEAKANYAEAIRLKPDYIKAHNEMLTCLYLMDRKYEFLDKLNFFIKENVANAVIGSLTCRSALKYGEENQNIFCNAPLEYVHHIDLKSRYNFEEIFVSNAKAILNEDKRSHKTQGLLSNGYQTSGNLFDIGNSFTDEIQKAIRLEIERYRINFESSQEGFLRKWSTDYSLYGWLISMKSGGELLPHIHDKGWLSGSIYINVPPKLKMDSGSLVVALGKDSDATNSRLNLKKVIDVVTGSMVLFPASLMHHTIPFESEEERIVLAFDVMPKGFSLAKNRFSPK